MSDRAAGERSAAGRDEDLLYERLRAYAAQWADVVPHDPGVALAELFAYLADALSAYQDASGHEADFAWGRYVRVRLQQGRVEIDADWHERSDDRRHGVYRATVVRDADHLLRRRLQVVIPPVSDVPLWALPCVPASGSGTEVPAVGAMVWVAFEDGDADYPVWLGVLPTVPQP